MKQASQIVLVFVFVVLLSGCATTENTSATKDAAIRVEKSIAFDLPKNRFGIVQKEYVKKGDYYLYTTNSSGNFYKRIAAGGFMDHLTDSVEYHGIYLSHDSNEPPQVWFQDMDIEGSTILPNGMVQYDYKDLGTISLYCDLPIESKMFITRYR